MEARNVCAIGTEGCNPFGGGHVVLSQRILFITFTISARVLFITFTIYMSLTSRIRATEQRTSMLLLIGFIRFQLDRITGADASTNIDEMHVLRRNVLDALIAAFRGIKAGDLSSFIEANQFETQMNNLSHKYNRNCHESVMRGCDISDSARLMTEIAEEKQDNVQAKSISFLSIE